MTDEVTKARRDAFNMTARERLQAVVEGRLHPKPPMPEHYDELDMPASEIRVGDWLRMPDGHTWVTVGAIQPGVSQGRPSLLFVHVQIGFSNAMPDDIERVRRPRLGPTEGSESGSRECGDS